MSITFLYDAFHLFTSWFLLVLYEAKRNTINTNQHYEGHRLQHKCK